MVKIGMIYSLKLNLHPNMSENSSGKNLSLHLKPPVGDKRKIVFRVDHCEEDERC